MKAWIDIDNPPQVQYLVPFIHAFERRGVRVVVTARDYGMTTELLRARGVGHKVIGRDFGSSRSAKWRGTAGRAARMIPVAARGGRPSLLLSTSRSAALAAWALRVPSYMVLDYEHVELRSFRAFGTTVLHPDAIDGSIFEAKGFGAERLVAFAGIKEDISFAGRDLDAVDAHDFGARGDGRALVLVRPPSETSHYFDSASRELTSGVLARLAAEQSVRVVFSARHPEQVAQLRTHPWRNEPIVLERPVEFVSLLKAVDGVICAGGTMLREAAYMGVPAISLFCGEVGAVDRRLAERGAVALVEHPEDLDAVRWLTNTSPPPLARHPEVVELLTDRMVSAR